MNGFDMNMVGILIAGTLTLMAYSFLYKENRAFRIVEHIYLGAGTGYGAVLSIKFVYENAWLPLVNGNLFWIIPLLASVLLYFYFSKKHFWLYRIPTAAIIGVGTGIVVAADFRTRLTEQIKATLIPLMVANDAYRSINNMIIVFGVIGSLLFFYFSAEFKGPIKRLLSFGKYILMITFGASFGQTLMARISLIIGKVQSLYTWPAWILILIAAVVMTVTIIRNRLKQKSTAMVKK
jgi:hypothetical protein